MRPEPEKTEPVIISEPPPALPNNTSVSRKKSTPSIPKLNSLKNAGKTAEPEALEKVVVAVEDNRPFTFDQLRNAWNQFAAKRKPFKAEYQLLNQEISLQENTVKIQLHNPVQETLLNGLRQELMQFIRETLGNYTIQVEGEVLMDDSRKIAYTNREKFEHLAEKNPSLLELKERLGLDPDF